MHPSIPSFLLCGLVCTLVSAGPSPQWLFQQIHALPGSDNEHVTADLHTKKSDIPEHKKRKDGVKKLFNFLDSAIQDSGSGSGEGSAQEQVAMATEDHSSQTKLTEKQVTKDESLKQQETTNSRDSAKQKKTAPAKSTNEHQAPLNMVKTSLTGYGREGLKSLPDSSPQSSQGVQDYGAASQQGAQSAYLAPQRTAGYAAYIQPRTTSTYAQNISPYARSMQGQKATNGYPVIGQQPHSYGYTASRRRPPAIPVRSQVTANNVLRPQQPVAAAQRFDGGPHRSNIQGPYYVTTTIIGPNEYGGYYVDQRGIPIAEGKSPEPLQEKPYGQPKRQRDQFHQQTRGLIPGRVPVRTYNRYPYPPLPANFPGQVRTAIQSHFPYQRANPLASRARTPVLQRPVVSPPNPAIFHGQVYYRNKIPQQHAGLPFIAHNIRQAGPAFSAHKMRSHGYPLIPQIHVGHGRAVINRKPQPRNVLASLTAAAARLVVPARPEAYENSATAESVWSSSAPQRVAHVVRSNTHPGNV